MGYLVVFLLTLVPPSSSAWHDQKVTAQFLAPPLAGRSRVELICNILTSLGATRDWFLSGLSQRIDREQQYNSNLSRVEATEGENCRRNADLHMPGGREFEQRNTIGCLNSWQEARVRLFGKLRHLKEVMHMGKLKHTHTLMHTRTHARMQIAYPEKAWENFKLSHLSDPKSQEIPY